MTAPTDEDGDGREFRCLGIHFVVGPTVEAIENGEVVEHSEMSLSWLTVDELLTVAREIHEAAQRGASVASVLYAWHTLRSLDDAE